MTLLSKAIYEIAKSDFQAANILAENHLYAQSIYFFAQTFEKTAKSSIALYLMICENKTDIDIQKRLKNIHGHNLIDSVVTMQKIFMDKEKELYLSRGGKEEDYFIQNAYNSLKEGIKIRYPMDELITDFHLFVKSAYNLHYKNLKEDELIFHLDKGWKFLRETFSNPRTEYFKYYTVAYILFPLLENMDKYTRYPFLQLNNNNIALLNEYKNKEACKCLSEMVGELV